MCSCKMPCELQVNKTTPFKEQASPYFSDSKVCLKHLLRSSYKNGIWTEKEMLYAYVAKKSCL